MSNAIPKFLSPSGLNSYLKCGLAWNFRYIHGFKNPPAGAMIRGRGLDEAANVHFKGIAKNNMGLEHDEFVSYAGDIHDQQIGQVVDMDVPIGQSKDLLLLASSAYYNKIAVVLQPRSEEDVQRKVETVIEDVPVLGYIDLVTTGPIGDTIVDTKLKSRMPSQAQVDSNIQLSSYAKFIDVRRVALAVAKPNGDTKIIVSEKSSEDLQRIGMYYRYVWDLINKGVAVPANPNTDWWCSKKWCGYWSVCPFGSSGKIGVQLSPIVELSMATNTPLPVINPTEEDDPVDYE